MSKSIYSRVNFTNNEEASKWVETVREKVNPSISTLEVSATPSVKTGKIFLTSSTTTITDFLNGTTGQEIIILAEHSVTITDGTNIFLSGSANYAMTDSDSLHLVQKADGNWYEISRSVN